MDTWHKGSVRARGEGDRVREPFRWTGHERKGRLDRKWECG